MWWLHSSLLQLLPKLWGRRFQIAKEECHYKTWRTVNIHADCKLVALVIRLTCQIVHCLLAFNPTSLPPGVRNEIVQVRRSGIVSKCDLLLWNNWQEQDSVTVRVIVCTTSLKGKKIVSNFCCFSKTPTSLSTRGATRCYKGDLCHALCPSLRGDWRWFHLMGGARRGHRELQSMIHVLQFLC